MRRLPPAVVALSRGDLDAARAADFLRAALAAFEAALPGLVLREPDLSDREYLALAEPLAAAARARGAWFCVHDRVHCAAELGAHAVQLGFRSLPPEVARGILPDSVALGRSTHAGDLAPSFAGCDFRVHGPVFDTPSKRGLVAPLGLAGVESAVRQSDVPVWAIGGLLPEHLGPLARVGARGAVARAAFFPRGASEREVARRVGDWLAASAEVSR